MELNHIHTVYFIGIGGIGMSALARYFQHRGVKVYGYDKTETTLTQALCSEGIEISYQDLSTVIPSEFEQPTPSTLVVYTPAIPKDSEIYNTFINRGFQLQKRSQVLGIISKGMYCIAIAGTHGKTTTSALTAHLLTHSGYGCSAFLGGIAANYQSNVLYGDNEVMVVEADEFDRSFLTLHPDIAVVTSMDADHLDIYHHKSHLEESFHLFVGQMKPNGVLFHKAELPLAKGISYDARNTNATIHAENVRVADGYFNFDYVHDTFRIEHIQLPLPGMHNVENSLAAIAIALQLNIDPEKIKAAMACFKGVKRRFEYILKTENQVYIDDYAHHPEELRACFDAVRMLYPNMPLTVVFQPHLFSRTRDFADAFAEVLSTVDDLILLEIYPARELPISGINATYLAEKIQLDQKIVTQKDQVIALIKEKKPGLLLTVGAGDIDTLVQPLKQVLSHV